MALGEGVDVQDAEGLLVLEDLVGLGFAGDDVAEYAGVFLGHLFLILSWYGEKTRAECFFNPLDPPILGE